MPLYDSTMAFATDRPIPQPPVFLGPGSICAEKTDKKLFGFAAWKRLTGIFKANSG